jgi:hypothetical protein
VRLQGFAGLQNLQILDIQSQETLESDYRQNKSPFAIALGDWFPLRTYFLTSKASPNHPEIVIVVIIIVIGEAHLVLHIGGIIAQTTYLDRVSWARTEFAGQVKSRHDNGDTNGGYLCKADVRFGNDKFLFIWEQVL